MPDAGVFLDVKERIDPDTADLGNAAEVIAQQIDDHQVFRPVFFRMAQFIRVAAARRGAFHRPGGERVAAALQKKFGGERNERALFRHNDAAVAHRLALAQGGIQRQRVAKPGEMERKGVIDLIAVAGLNQGLNVPNGLRVGLEIGA
ncbi:MAG: hypothetical protein BWY57_01283 [Betaproteobacteria bacterium ADurb.Bin341]|nr:MAG: hypothetical protein BWY57_01283 [Betaproteobacteria bacterium ADurb.Bin341]